MKFPIAVLLITEADAIHDPAAHFQQARGGFEIVIEGESVPIARNTTTAAAQH